MIYDITGHPMLTGKAALLDSTELAAHAEVAEILLKFHTFTAFEAGTDDYKRAASAIAMQVSFQVESGVEAFVMASLHRGGRNFSFRKGNRNMPPTHNIAKKTANALRRIALGTATT